MVAIPTEYWKVLMPPPRLRQCRICGGLLEWNPILLEWSNHVEGNRHYCPDEAIQALIPDVHECLQCQRVVLVYQDGRRLGQDLTAHQCKRRPAKKRRVKPTPRKQSKRCHRGAVDI